MKSQWRRWIIALNLDGVIRSWFGGRGIVLMLHRVRTTPDLEQGDQGLWVLTEQLQAIITTLRDQLNEALARMSGRNPSRFACLTFDDGYRDNYEIAFPLLRYWDVPATIYITTGFIEGTALAWWYGVQAILDQYPIFNVRYEDHQVSWPTANRVQKHIAYQAICAKLRTATPTVYASIVNNLQQDYAIDFRRISMEQMLTPEMVRELAASDQIELGAHTVAHPVLSTLPLIDARMEMIDSKQRLESLCGQPVHHFAYPYGDRAAVNSTVQTLAEECGFRSAALAYGGPIYRDSDRYALPRIPFGGEDSTEDLRVRTSGFRTLLDRMRSIPT